MSIYHKLNIGVVADTPSQGYEISRRVQEHAKAFDVQKYIDTETIRMDEHSEDDERTIVRIKVHIRSKGYTLCQVIVWRILRDYPKLHMQGFEDVYGFDVNIYEDHASLVGLPDQMYRIDNLKEHLADVTQRVLDKSKQK